MARQTFHLFVAWVESLLLTVVGLNISGVAALLGASGLATWGYTLQATTLVPTLVVHLIFFTSEKRAEIRADGKLDDGRAAVLDISYATAMSNAYCGTLFLATSYITCMYLQAVQFGSTLSDEQIVRYRGADAYISTNRVEWGQGTTGGLSWERTGNRSLAGGEEFRPTEGLAMGTALLGVVQGYLVVMLLVSMYTAYTSTPEGGFNVLFMDSRMLTVSNAFVVFGARGIIEGVFVTCMGVAGSGAAGFSVFAAIVCFEEYAIGAASYVFGRDVHDRLYTRGPVQPIVLSFLALIPLFVSIGMAYKAPILVASSILSFVAVSTAWARFFILYYAVVPAAILLPLPSSTPKAQVPGSAVNSMQTLFSMARPLDGRYKGA